jgi:hypothetical protein
MKDIIVARESCWRSLWSLSSCSRASRSILFVVELKVRYSREYYLAGLSGACC